MTPPRLVATYVTAADFLTAHDAEVQAGGLLVRGAVLEKAVAQAECVVAVQVEGEPVAEVPARVAAVVPGVGVAVTFSAVPEALSAHARRLRTGATKPEQEEEAPRADHRHISERLQALSVAQKMQLGLSGSREERFFLLRDTNKALHPYVLRNPRIGLDEVQAAAKMNSLAAEAIKLIAEHTQWSVNPSICTALVRNPSTPMPIALRLMDRVPHAELRALAKGGARMPIVQAARKRING